MSIKAPKELTDFIGVDVSGEYELKEKCGTAMGALHVRKENNNQNSPLYLFLDPDR